MAKTYRRKKTFDRYYSGGKQIDRKTFTLFETIGRDELLRQHMKTVNQARLA